jgi:hypothetical protein
MKDKQSDYEKVVKELIKDRESYDSWAPEDKDADEIRSMLNETIWGDQ